MLAAVVLLTGACTGEHHRKDSPATTEQIPAGGGTVTSGQFTITMPAGTVATTTRVTVKPDQATPTPGAATILKPLTSQIDVALDQGAQPGRPVTITATPTDPAAVTAAARGSLLLLSRDGRTQAWDLTPATYDPARRLLTATVDHFSLFGFVHIDVSGPYHQMLDVVKAMFDLDGAAKPACAGKPLKAGDTTYTLDQKYRGAGDGIVWPCLTESSGGKIELSLANATGLPWLIRSRPAATVTDPGTVDLSKAALMAFYHQFLDGGTFAQSLMLPAVTKTYTFDGGKLPGLVDLRLDGFAQQAMALIWALRFALDLFFPLARVTTVLTRSDFIGCVADLVKSQTAGVTATGLGSFAKAFFDCKGPIVEAMDSGVGPVHIADIVIAALAGGVTLILNDLFSLYRTVVSKDHTQVTIGRTTPAFPLTAGGVGPLAFGSSGSSAETTLKAAFGPPTRITDGPFCDLGGGDPGRQRLLSWGNLTVALHGESLHGGGLTVRSWQVTAGRLTAPVKLPHGLVPGNTYYDLIGNAPGAHVEPWIDDSETEMLDADGVQYFFDGAPIGQTPISTVAAGVIPCD